MTAYTANLEAINRKLDDIGAGLEQTVAALKPARKVTAVDVAGREQVLEPDRIIHLAGYEQKLRDRNAVIDATICLFNAANNGRLVTAYLPGKPEDVARQLGIMAERVELTQPTPRVLVTSIAEANAAIAASQSGA